MTNVDKVKQAITTAGFNIGCVDPKLNDLTPRQLNRVLKCIATEHIGTVNFTDTMCEIEYPDDNNELDVTINPKDAYGWH